MRPSATAPIWSAGIDPLEIDRDPKGQLDGIFAIAARHGIGLDIHLHEPGEMGLFNVEEICARTKALGLGGKVTISHGFCLGGITERKAAKAAETMAEARVALVTHGAGGLTMPPIEMLRAAGVLVFAGNDDIRDTWSPYGSVTCWNERRLSDGKATSDAMASWRSPST
jgi:cytosine deaminase